MRTFTQALALALLAGVTAFLFNGCASDDQDLQAQSNGAAARPYPRNVCLVTDAANKQGKPYTFVYEGQEIKLCCSSATSLAWLTSSREIRRGFSPGLATASDRHIANVTAPRIQATTHAKNSLSDFPGRGVLRDESNNGGPERATKLKKIP